MNWDFINIMDKITIIKYNQGTQDKSSCKDIMYNLTLNMQSHMEKNLITFDIFFAHDVKFKIEFVLFALYLSRELIGTGIFPEGFGNKQKIGLRMLPFPMFQSFKMIVIYNINPRGKLIFRDNWGWCAS